MIDHNLFQFNLDQNYVGYQVQPSEQGNMVIPSTLRQFIVQAYRSYSSEALLNAQQYNAMIVENQVGQLTHKTPYFYFKLSLNSSNDIEDFFSQEGDEFLEYLLGLLSISKARNCRGNRAAFCGLFKQSLSGDMVSHALIGTSVFYNDYRVTTNFPSAIEGLQKFDSYIHTELMKKYPHLKITSSFNAI